jgi:hypothetical protein
VHIAVNQQGTIDGAAAHAIFANNRPANHPSSAVKGLPRIKIDFAELLLCHKIFPEYSDKQCSTRRASEHGYLSAARGSPKPENQSLFSLDLKNIRPLVADSKLKRILRCSTKNTLPDLDPSANFTLLGRG